MIERTVEGRTVEGGALTKLILRVFSLNGGLEEAGNSLSRPHGLTSAQWKVLGAIAGADAGALTVAQIARKMGLARQGLRGTVGRLEKADMVVLRANPDHQRAKLVALTPGGEKALRSVGQAQVAWVNELAKGLDTTRLAEAIKLLETIDERLKRSAELQGDPDGIQ